MSDPTEWTKLLNNHPIFSLPQDLKASTSSALNPLELSTTTLPNFNNGDAYTPSGRRQVMLLKDSDLIVASGKELRISAFGDLKLSQSVRKMYKTLHTPAVDFDIHQIAINPSGKLLAVAGTTSVAVVVLPRGGYSRMVSDLVECRAVQIGQFYHSMKDSPPIAKIDWHPWGDAGSTLLVMTVDGKLREYDISVDTEEPQQVLSFVKEQKTSTFNAVDASEREVASFTLGKGLADWGPLTVYAIMKSGDVYSICPYLPQNASVPPDYVLSLQEFITKKQQKLTDHSSSNPKELSPLYIYQNKYVAGLVKQLPVTAELDAESTPVTLHPPKTIKAAPLRQGPFLLNPAPRDLEGSDGGDATDITYLSLPITQPDRTIPEQLGVLVASYQDGRVDIFLDVDKVEATWDAKQLSNRVSAMFAVYETIDLGLINTLKQTTEGEGGSSSLLDLLQANHPVILPDPLQDDMLYVYHAFGVHSLDLAPVMQSLKAVAQDEADGSDKAAENANMTKVTPVLNTFSAQRKCSNPIIAVNIPNDVYINYGIFILTSAMRILPLPLTLRAPLSDTKPSPVQDGTGASTTSKWLTPLEGPPLYVTLNSQKTYEISKVDLPSIPKPPIKAFPPGSKEWMLTRDSFQYIGETVKTFNEQFKDVHTNVRKALAHCTLLDMEKNRQVAKCREMEQIVEKLKGPTRVAIQSRLATIQAEQKTQLARLDRLLQAFMQKASPELSEYEAKWFQELKRMKQEVLGRAKYDEDSLISKTRLLEKEYARILPALQTLAEKEVLVAKKHAENNQNLGFSQAFEYGQRSTFDKTKITTVEKEISKLAANLQISLPRPPQAA